MASTAGFGPDDDRLVDQLFQASGHWAEQSGPIIVWCPECGEEVPVAEWVSSPPLGFGDLSFTFSDWQELDAPGWKIDIRAFVKEITGHRVVSSCGEFLSDSRCAACCFYRTGREMP